LAHREAGEGESLETDLAEFLATDMVDSESVQNETNGQLPTIWGQRYIVVKVLGQGTFGKVLQCQLICNGKPTNHFVAVKAMRDKQSAKREIDVLSIASDMRKSRRQQGGFSGWEFVVNFEEDRPAYIDELEFAFVMIEYLSLGSGEELKPGVRPAVLKEPGITFALLYQVGRGLRALHNAGFVHADIKPENIMINIEQPCPLSKLGCVYASVIDLGIVTNYPTNGGCNGGSPGYMAPEAMGIGGPRQCTPACDVWSYGMLIYNTVSKDVCNFRSLQQAQSDLYSGRINAQMYETFFNNFMGCIQNDCTTNFARFTDFYNLLQGMLMFDTTRRFSMEQVAQLLASMVENETPEGSLPRRMLLQSPMEYGARLPRPC